MPSGPEWFIVLVVVLVIFGGSQLPKLARNLGKAQKEFKDGLAEAQREDRRRPPSRRPPTDVADRPRSSESTTARSTSPDPATDRDVSRPTTARRRRFRIRRRSRSLHPPHTPWSMRCSRAYSRQGR